MSERENILELKNVVYSFHTYGGEVKAVRDVSYEVRQGEILGIVGRVRMWKECNSSVYSASESGAAWILRRGGNLIQRAGCPENV